MRQTRPDTRSRRQSSRSARLCSRALSDHRKGVLGQPDGRRPSVAQRAHRDSRSTAPLMKITSKGASLGAPSPKAGRGRSQPSPIRRHQDWTATLYIKRDPIQRDNTARKSREERGRIASCRPDIKHLVGRTHAGPLNETRENKRWQERPPLTAGLHLQPGIGISKRRQFWGKEIFAWNLQHPGQKGLIRHVESPDLAINHGTAMARRLRQMLRDAGVFEAGVLHDPRQVLYPARPERSCPPRVPLIDFRPSSVH